MVEMKIFTRPLQLHLLVDRATQCRGESSFTENKTPAEAFTPPAEKKIAQAGNITTAQVGKKI